MFGPETRGLPSSILDALPAELDGQAVRHVRVPGGFEVRVDGRSGRAVVRPLPA